MQKGGLRANGQSRIIHIQACHAAITVVEGAKVDLDGLAFVGAQVVAVGLPGLGVAAHVEQGLEGVAIDIQDQDVLLVIGELGLVGRAANGQALRGSAECPAADRVEPEAELDALGAARQVVDNLVAG